VSRDRNTHVYVRIQQPSAGLIRNTQKNTKINTHKTEANTVDCYHGSPTWTGLSGHWHLFVLVSLADEI